MRVFNVQIRLAKQEDGLWRATVPGLRGCFVDAPTMEQAIGEIQEAVAMFVDFLEERGEALPPSLGATSGDSFSAVVPVDVTAYHFITPKPRRVRSAAH